MSGKNAIKEICFKPFFIGLFFDEKVRMQCRSCKRYGRKATCPPYIETLEYYKKLLPEYKHCVIYYKKYDTDRRNWRKQGKESSLKLHEFILKERDCLVNNGHIFAVGFGGGSCKLCDACSFPCRNPSMGLTPFEATGLDITRLMRHFGVDVHFPVNSYFYRVGAIFYD